MNTPNGAKKRKFPWGLMVAFVTFALVACIYLLRLEAYTRADIFLPTNYHAVVEAAIGSVSSSEIDNGITDDALMAYYQDYTRQTGRPYTIRQDVLLSRLAYTEAPEGFRGEVEGVTVRALCDEAERILDERADDAALSLGRKPQVLRDMIADIREHSLLEGLTIREYIDDPSGLAGYVLGNGNEITIALRGTDGLLDNMDNALLLPFNLSMQYGAVRTLLEKYGDADRIWLTGHSKGGHNAIYAASIDARCHATGFNAPGFGIFLSDAQHDGLDNGVNYVINGDIVGFLLFHLERRVVLESTSTAMEQGRAISNHWLDNFFTVDDLVVAREIKPAGIWIEWITQLLWLLLVFFVGHMVFKLLRKLLRRARDDIRVVGWGGR